MDGERERLRAAFDGASEQYHDARPEYPEALFERLVAVTGVRGGDRALEVGCGTGKATLPLARRGLAITCVESGVRLAAVARRNLAGCSGVTVIQDRFEDVALDASFELVFAATAWHWIDPAVKYRRAHEALRPGGHLAFWSATHVIPEGGDPFFAEIQDVYDEIGEGRPPGSVWPRPGELAGLRDEVEASGLFNIVDVREFDWATVYDADGYIALLETFSGHRVMAPWQRDRLYGEIRRRLAARAEPRLVRHWGANLHVARRL